MDCVWRLKCCESSKCGARVWSSCDKCKIKKLGRTCERVGEQECEKVDKYINWLGWFEWCEGVKVTDCSDLGKDCTVDLTNGVILRDSIVRVKGLSMQKRNMARCCLPGAKVRDVIEAVRKGAVFKKTKTALDRNQRRRENRQRSLHKRCKIADQGHSKENAGYTSYRSSAMIWRQ